MPDQPLSGVRILAFTQMAAGPYAMMTLADLGAEVIKVEDPVTGGDEARQLPPHATGADSPYFQSLNRNARSLTLNLRVPEGRAVFRRLVGVSDAVYANVRGDLPAKLGLDYASLKDANPRIVCCCLSGFGKTGPRAAEPGYDALIQALSGFMALTGEPDGPPTRCGVSVTDFAGGIMSAVGLLSGVLRARATGLGCDLDVSLFDTSLSMLSYLATWSLSFGQKLQRMPGGAHQTVVPAQTFATRDGWIVIMCMKEKFWVRFAERCGLGAMAADPRFASVADRMANRDALVAIVGEALRCRTTKEWLEILGGEVPCAPVLDVEQALGDDQTAARASVVEVPHAEFGTLRQIANPLRFEGIPGVYAPASALGGDSEAILGGLLGMSAEDIAVLRSCGAV